MVPKGGHYLRIYDENNFKKIRQFLAEKIDFACPNFMIFETNVTSQQMLQLSKQHLVIFEFFQK